MPHASLCTVEMKTSWCERNNVRPNVRACEQVRVRAFCAHGSSVHAPLRARGCICVCVRAWACACA
eukprot:4432817-Pleurochrysis_carterae.AAC.1